MNGPLAWALGVAVLGACAASSVNATTAPSESVLYLTDAGYRRAELAASLVNPANGYSALRLAHYDTGDAADWSRLPESNPRAEVVLASELDAAEGALVGTRVGSGATSLAISEDALAGDPDALVALGEDAFFHYPVQTSLAVERATVSRGAFADYGFWVDDARGAGGLVRQETPDGTPLFAFTCATCHAASRSGALLVGVGNDALDLGRLTVNASVGADPTVVANLLAWGRGRVDVTTTLGTEPVRLADTRPVRWLGFLHADATVAVRDITALAIRIETLIVTSHATQDRPPRAVALGLALYLESLAATLPTAASLTPSAARGAALFAANCTRCHAEPALTGAPVSLAVVGTDPTLGLSENRGTGTYRVPSLHGVGTRGPLLHDGSLPDLATMFDPARTSATFTGGRLGPGPVAGHPFGLALSPSERADLVAYLGTL